MACNGTVYAIQRDEVINRPVYRNGTALRFLGSDVSIEGSAAIAGRRRRLAAAGATSIVSQSDGGDPPKTILRLPRALQQ